MRSKRYFLSWFVLLSLLFSIFPVRASEIPICHSAGYTVGFFNGVWNSPQQANQSNSELKKLVREMYGDTYQEEPIRFELFYNTTNGLLDVMEVFIQRSAEIDASGELGRRLEYLWGALTGNASFLNRAKSLFPDLMSFFGWLYDSVIQKFLMVKGQSFITLPTVEDYARHDEQLKWLVGQQRKLILVAHSQGNLFVNRAFEMLRAMGSERDVQVVHVAPASVMLSGPYVLADIDWVIKGLRTVGLSSIASSNLELPLSSEDRSGHGFVETYLDGSRSGRGRIKGLLNESFEKLKEKLSEEDATCVKRNSKDEGGPYWRSLYGIGSTPEAAACACVCVPSRSDCLTSKWVVRSCSVVSHGGSTCTMTATLKSNSGGIYKQDYDIEVSYEPRGSPYSSDTPWFEHHPNGYNPYRLPGYFPTFLHRYSQSCYSLGTESPNSHTDDL